MRVFIAVPKDDALAITSEDYAAFLSARVEKLNQSGQYASYTIVFDDGTGIIYYGCDPINNGYGAVDDEGSEIIEPFGCVFQDENGSYSYISFSEDSTNSNDIYNKEIEKLLLHSFTSSNMDGASLTVTVQNHKAEVVLTISNISSLFRDAETFMDSSQAWNDLLLALTNAQISVMDICKTLDYGEYEFAVVVTGGQVPYATITNGEVTFNMADIFSSKG